MRMDGTTVHPAPTDSDLVSTYLSWVLDVRGRQQATVESYASTLRTWRKWLDHSDARLADATLQDLEGFQQRPRHKRGRGGNGATATQRREIACLRGFYRWLHTRGHIGTDPFIEAQAPTVRARQPRPVSDAVWLAAWGQDMPDPLRAAMGLGFFCGLRRAEIVSLTVAQLTDTRIVGFVRKGGGEDTLPWRTLVDVYEQHLPHLGHQQFTGALNRVRRHGTHITPYREPDWLNRAMHAAGLGFTPHQLRHSAATNLIRAGTPLPIVSRMMNHSNISTTMLYVKAGGDELRDWLHRADSQTMERADVPVDGEVNGDGRQHER